ncbi:hypothetical protein [Arenibacter certesii]|uniref:Lipoprotein n=1 Tax=Arenibacter certesii TaxID=228955 RepID=A0A918MQY0_9FLAO|nr:hypothetical protein [Arenibacter certesii]GGW45405.1 hypothetical protein GCM10007383_32220 [Arenibacter certesii]
MKKYVLVLGISFALMAQIGCKSSKATQNAQKKESMNMATTKGSQAAQSSKASEKEVVEEDNTTNLVQGYNGSTGSNVNVNSASLEVPITTKEDFAKMYTELNMTDNQIKRLESAIKEFEDKQRNAPNGKMMGTISSERERQLKQILSDEQYSSYEQWKKNN